MGMNNGQQMVADLRPDRRDTEQQVTVGFQVGMPVDMVVDVVLELAELLLQKGNRIDNGLMDTGWRIDSVSFFQPVAFALQVLGNRFTAGQQGL
jgi:hypothetical protein